MPAMQPKRGRLWLADGSIVRRRAGHRDHVWAYDFVFDRTADGRKLRLLTIVDEYTRECLAVDVARRLNSQDVLARLAELFVRRGVPVHIRSDNGPEFTARAVRHWLKRLEVQTLFIQPGSPWENGYVESFNGKLRDECLNLERFDTLLEAQVLVERWRCQYNQLRPHSSLGYRPPAPEAAPEPVTPGRLAPVLALRLVGLVVHGGFDGHRGLHDHRLRLAPALVDQQRLGLRRDLLRPRRRPTRPNRRPHRLRRSSWRAPASGRRRRPRRPRPSSGSSPSTASED